MRKNTVLKIYLASIAVISFILLLSLNTVAYAVDQPGYRYYFKQLNGFQKQLYEFILSAPHETALYTIDVVDDDLSLYTQEEIKERVYDARWACDLDNPEQTSWINDAYWYSCDQELNKITIKIEKSEYYDIEDTEKIGIILDRIEANANPSWDNYTKAYYIASTIYSSMKYDYDYVFYNTDSKPNVDKQHITGIINGVAVCEGYSEIFKALADRLDLPCVEVCGPGHAFVHIMMDDGKWYGHDPQNELYLNGNSMYQGELRESGWVNIYDIFDKAYYYLVQPHRTEEDYPIYEIGYTLNIPNVTSIRAELNTGEPKFEYTANDDGTTCTIVGYKGTQEGNLIIPDEIDGYIVRIIGNSAFAFCNQFSGNLYLPDTIEQIGTGAFAHCNGLKGDIVLPESLLVIENGAFIGCDGFNGSIIFNNRLKTISSSAFADCSHLTGDLLLPDSLEEIGTNAFNNCQGLNGVVHIPALMESWNASILDSCVNLSGFDVSDSDPRFSVVDGILYNKEKTELLQCLKAHGGNVTIPEGVTTVASQAFYQCTNVTSVQLPETIRYIGSWAFGSMTGRAKSDFVIPSSIESIGECAFYNSNLAGTIYYPSIDDVAFNAFGWNLDVRRVVIPEGVTSIPNGCFATIEVKEAIIPESVTYIGADAFDTAYDLTIFGVPGSYAETYAKANQEKRFRFLPISQAFHQDVFSCYLDVDGEKYPKSAELSAHWLSTGEPVEFSSWSVSDTEIAEVVSGIVTAKAGGFITVKGITTDGTELTWFVYNSKYPERVNAGAERTELFVGQETFVFASFVPFESCVYGEDSDLGIFMFSSSDSSIVEVDENKGNVIKAKGIGSVTITASNAAGMESSFDVSVVEKSQLIPSLDGLSVLRLPSSLKVIEERAFAQLNCQAIIILDGCNTIGEHAFEECYNLQYVRIPSSIKIYPKNAFENCPTTLLIDWQKE